MAFTDFPIGIFVFLVNSLEILPLCLLSIIFPSAFYLFIHGVYQIRVSYFYVD